MTVTKFDESDAYTVVDIAGIKPVVGPVRCAKKVLQRTTTDLARHATYALAAHGIEGAGAAAALNLDTTVGDRAAAIESFSRELVEWAKAADFRATAGLGVDLGELGSIARRQQPPSDRELVAASAVASMLDNDRKRIVVACEHDEPELMSALTAVGQSTIESVDDLATALAIESKATFVRAKTGALTHGTLADTNAAQIIGLQPLTTTARGLAVAGRRGAVVVPDFVSAAGPYLAAVCEIDEPAALLTDITERTRIVRAAWEATGTNAFITACEAAEAYLRTWTDDLPFGRPLAP